MLEFATLQTIGTGVVAIVVILIAIAIFVKPLGCLLRLFFNTIGGFIVLFILNFFGGFIGISLGLNWFNAVIVGIFGLPGVGFLLILQFILLA
ncbi:MAG: pro-sigmaK processing inhibitor BofA family protein [Oscillospiraceae bacterium]|nr:pro-sigmaK processing inhibitor BofA family protein [Oscillospiraceae bacterium]